MSQMACYVDEDAIGGVWRVLLDDYFDGLYNLLYTKQWNVSHYELSSFKYIVFLFFFSVLFQQIQCVPAHALMMLLWPIHHHKQDKFAKQNKRNVIML